MVNQIKKIIGLSGFLVVLAILNTRTFAQEQPPTYVPTMAGITAVTTGQSTDQPVNPLTAFTTAIQTIIAFGQCPDGQGACSTLVDMNRYAKKAERLVAPSLTKNHQQILKKPQDQPGYDFPREQYFSEPCDGKVSDFNTNRRDVNTPLNVAQTVSEAGKADAKTSENLFIFGGSVGSSNRPDKSGITLNMQANYPKIYDQNNKLTNEGIKMPCGADSKGIDAKPTPAPLEGAAGTLGLGKSIELSASFGTIRDFVLGSITCLTLSQQGENCRSQLSATTTMTVFSAGQTGSFCITSDCANTPFAAGTDPAELANVKAQKGTITGLMMTKLTKDQTRMAPEESHGKTPGNASVSLGSANTAVGQIPHQFKGQQMRDLQLGMDCAPLPKLLQERYGMTCKPPVEEGPLSCDNAQPPNLNFSISDTSCTIRDVARASQLVGQTIPQNMINIINKAADTFKVHPAVILATIYHEGAFSRGIQWSDSYVQQYAACGAEIPECKPAYDSGSAAIPFGWYKKYFFDPGSSPYAAVQNVDPSRSKEEVSACNVLDGIFATAKHLRTWSYNLSRYTYGLTRCKGYTVTNKAPPTSCGSWNVNMIAQAMMGYNGYCPGGYGTIPYPNTSQFPANNPFIERGVTFFNALK